MRPALTEAHWKKAGSLVQGWGAVQQLPDSQPNWIRVGGNVTASGRRDCNRNEPALRRDRNIGTQWPNPLNQS